jgi:hypothetical protein
MDAKGVEKTMVYKEGLYTLHQLSVNLRGGRKQMIYFFSKAKPKNGTPCDIPNGYKIGGKNKKTGLPYLSKK